jgi:hypothetical protein
MLGLKSLRQIQPRILKDGVNIDNVTVGEFGLYGISARILTSLPRI